MTTPPEAGTPAPVPSRARRIWKSYGGGMVMWAILLGLCVQRGGGFFIPFIAFFWFIVSVIRLLLAIRAPEKRDIRLRKFAGGLACLCIMWGAHAYYRHDSQARAEALIAQVTAFKSRNGRYPTPREIGAADGPYGPGVARYHLDDESKTPVLFHADSFIIFGACFYNFDDRTWKCEQRD